MPASDCLLDRSLRLVVASHRARLDIPTASSPRPRVRRPAPDVGDGWRSRPCGRRRVPLRSSTRARCPSGEQPCHPCWQSPAACFYPSKRIHDLPWPRCSSLPSRFLRPPTSSSPGVPSANCATTVPQRIDSVGDSDMPGSGRRGRARRLSSPTDGVFRVSGEAGAAIWALTYPLSRPCAKSHPTLINTGA